MKNIFAIIFSLLIGQFVFGQKTPISYVNNERVNDSSVNPWVIDNRISEITLTSKNEFEFRSFPIPSSCLTWREHKGTWERKNDTLIFSEQYEIVESDARFTFSNKNKNEYYHLEFGTDKKSKLSDKHIEIKFVYDFDSDFKDVKLKMELENDFSLKIPYNQIPNRKNLASIRFEYFLPNGEKRNGYITENQTVNVKEKDLPNYIGITLIEKPKKEIIYRITKAILIDNKIKIISKEKSKTNLPDYTEDIEFKEIYENES
ncbi:hypothetical protein BXY82_3153 [Gelidibacter sediminis]|uniref:Uncharacterized protein n=1 Tax=Gelidibacter sediminis TaxID=1608710 RepID=A0A4V6Q4F4_9FLAO|nr:hypothetical protein [Gelidibacter sediminis]TDU33696.1 hypothetical protein BXY82_3153 [Gelidibacter sediminis]